MSVIIGLSGKKQSGKTTLSEHLEKVIKSKGLAYKNYSFAEPLKINLCMSILGLTYEQVNGTDEQKNSLTKYRWENFPMFIRQAHSDEWEDFPEGFYTESYSDVSTMTSTEPIDKRFITTSNEGYTTYNKRKKPRTGRMSARKVMQVVGTDIFRNMFSKNVWVDAALSSIKNDNENVDLATITDVRFKTEIEPILELNGNIIRLERNVCNDNHPSETELDDYDFESLSKEGRAIIVPEDASIDEMNAQAEAFVNKLLA